jgi:multiple sugar transport system substrate-binding protein
MQAIRAYFSLMRYANEEGRNAMREKIHTPLFHKGLSAITFGTIRMATPEGQLPREVAENWGWASLPQPCFVGGSNLVIWKHTRNKRAALKLVEFLTKGSTLARSNPPLATLPPLLSVLKTPQFTENPMYTVMSSAIERGRSYPHLRLWGLVEDKLVNALLQIGADLLNSPTQGVDQIITSQIEIVTRRISMMLSQ